MRFDVTPDALDGLARTLHDQATTLDPVPRVSSLDTAPAVNGALDLVFEQMQSTFRDVTTNLNAIAISLSSAATTYRSNDDALTAATTP